MLFFFAQLYVDCIVTQHGTHVSLTYALYVSICAAKCSDAVIFSSGSKLFMCDDYRWAYDGTVRLAYVSLHSSDV